VGGNHTDAILSKQHHKLWNPWYDIGYNIVYDIIDDIGVHIMYIIFYDIGCYIGYDMKYVPVDSCSENDVPEY
jgi:hypothetical protein